MWFRIDYEESKRKNYEEKVHKVEEILRNWGDKRFTLISKIAVMMALVASPLVYIMASKSSKETNDHFLISLGLQGE